VPATALVLTLAAALLHAGWNLLLARPEDTESTTAVVLIVGVVAGAPIAAATWNVHGAALPYLAAASVLQLAYIALLAAAYARADMSLVYPLARGLAPVIVLGISVIALGVTASALQAVGVACVAGGVVLVRGLRLEPGAGRGNAGALTYVELEMLLPTVVYASVIAQIRGRHALRAACSRQTVAAGIAMFGGYALVLLALERASAPAVSAVRESSVVLATALAAIVLHERVTAVRVAGAVVVVGGIALIALG
jgi:drug/metabolite transporter (DMT)-like permease